jgi:hypothetical protein
MESISIRRKLLMIITKSLSQLLLIIAIPCLLIFSSSAKASAQQMCPGFGSGFENGAIWLRAQPTPLDAPDFVGGLLGTFELLSNGTVSGGIDWLYNDKSPFETSGSDKLSFETSNIGAQLITWFTRKNNKNTLIQVTNVASSPVEVNVSLFNDACLEICDFCDTYTPKDTHVYNLADLKRNDGTIVGCSVTLADSEGLVIVTPVNNCFSPDPTAIGFPKLYGDARIIDTFHNIEYGNKLWARDVDKLSDCATTAPGDYPELTGEGNCRFRSVPPPLFGWLRHVFSTLPGSIEARADLVFFSIKDNFGSPSDGFRYRTEFPPALLFEDIVDDNENRLSCGDSIACFSRLGINDAIPNSDSPFPVISANCDPLAPGAIIGTYGDDVLTGTPGNDVIIGLGGNDTIDGGDGIDCIDGGAGDDLLAGGKGNDNLDGGPGNDTIDGEQGNDTCTNGETNISC